jgi:hypothetical protein
MIKEQAITGHPVNHYNQGSVTSIHSSRRRFLQAAAAAVVVGISDRLQASDTHNRPNVLIISTDRQFADAISRRIGSQFLHTPNLDQLAASGVVFARAYSANPPCMPSRASMKWSTSPANRSTKKPCNNIAVCWRNGASRPKRNGQNQPAEMKIAAAGRDDEFFDKSLADRVR